MIGKLPVCYSCKHLRTLGKSPQGFTCDAFPDGIPQEILYGARHDDPWPGDHGIQFEQASDAVLKSRGVIPEDSGE